MRRDPLARAFWAMVGAAAAGLFVLLLLTGCATDGAGAKVPVNVPVYCHPKLGAEPAYPDTDAALQAAPDIFTGVQLLLEGRLERIQRDREKSAALAACAGPPAS
jgi:hypothetical protein